MTPVILGALATVVVALAVWLLVRGEYARRRAWFEAAKSALGASFSEFAAVPSTDRYASQGQLEGGLAVFQADRSATEARLEVPLRAGVEKGRVFDLIVREERGALEARDGAVLIGWDDEHDRIILRTHAGRDAQATVSALRDEAKSFQEKLPALLEERAKARAERASKTFGELTGANGRHKLLGLALALAPEEWELVNARPEGVEWEQVPPDEGDAPPVELRLYALAAADALKDEEPRLRLLERIAGAFAERLPDGAFPGPAPEPRAQSASPLAGAPCAAVAVDHDREVVVREEESEPRPYRAIFHGVFQPWAVAVLEVVAPRDAADALLAKVLAGASFEKPEKA